jgi:hypothetical protein
MLDGFVSYVSALRFESFDQADRLVDTPAPA